MRNLLVLMVDNQLVAQEGLVLAVGKCMGILYADSGMVGSRYPEWLQGALNMLVSLFRWYGLVVNVANSKAMTCQTVTLRSGILEETVG